MYRAYLVPDATMFNNRKAMYQSKRLLWDPYSESDVYAVIGPKTKGEINKADSFEFTILPANVCYEQIQKKISVVIIYDDDEWIFEGVVADCSKDFYKQMKVTCAGPLSYLCDSVQAPDEKNQVVIPAPPRVKYSRVPEDWYNDTNPKEQGWYERSREPDEDGNEHYVYTVTDDRMAQVNKKYYYISSGDSDNQSGVTVTKKAATKETIHDHIDRFLAVHNSQVDAFKQIYMGECSEDDTSEHEFKSSNYRETWTAIKSDILDQYGHYFRTWLDTDYKLRLDYASLTDLDSSTEPETSIVFTENMLEMTESDDSDDDIFTVLVPTGKNNLTFKSSYTDHDNPAHSDHRMINPYIKAMGGNKRFIVVSQAAIDKFGYIVKTQTFSDASNQDKLWSAAVKYIKNNFDTHSEYEVKGIDAHALNPRETRIAVGKKCRIKSDWHDVDENDLYVITAEHDLANPDNDSFKIGIPTSDREAKNKTITGQTRSSATSSANGYANNASNLNNMETWLYEYFDQVEGWLEQNHKWRNEVGTITNGLLTRIEQAEDHITLLSTKLFGDTDAGGDPSAGYILIPKPPYRKTGNGIEDYYDGASDLYKVPANHGWYEKKVENGKTVYRKSTQDYRITQSQVDDDNVQFYIRRLASRDSEINVDENGINFTVNGNYTRSVANSSWIRINEDQIIALTGHLYVDEDGHIHIISGGGMRVNSETDYHYILVPKMMYTNNPSPVEKHWYERKYDSNNNWPGATAADRETNGKYYKATSDTVIDQNKAYYYRSGSTETITNENGVFDEDNLTAGVLARTINHPTYVKVTALDIAFALKNGKNPATSGWFEYDETTGNYGVSTDTVILSTKTYYKQISNATTYTELRGDHIRVGNPDEEVDAAVRARAEQYIRDKNLNGTITEIASDVVIVNTLIAKYIEADEITANTSLSTDNLDFNNGMCFGSLEFWADQGYSTQGTTINFNDISTGSVDCAAIAIGSSSAVNDEIIFGNSSTGIDIDDAQDPADIIMGFGTVTTSGDTVTIPYLTAGDEGTYDPEHIISFNKPASLGTVAWDSGNIHDTLAVNTAGGTRFFDATLTHPTIYTGDSTITYNRDGSNLTSNILLRNKPTLKATMNVSGTWTGESHDPSEDDPIVWTRDIFFDASQAYNDGQNYAKELLGFVGPVVATDLTSDEESYINSQAALAYNTVYQIYKTYGNVQYGDRRLFKTPIKPSANGGTEVTTGGHTYVDGGHVNLGYDQTFKVQGKYKLSDESTYSYAGGITFRTPINQHNNGADTLRISPSDGKDLDYDEEITVTASTTYLDGSKNEKTITFTAPKDNGGSGANITANSIDIPNDGFEMHDYDPSLPGVTVRLNQMEAAVKNAVTNQKWFHFTVKVKNTSAVKYYKMNFSST